VKIFTGLSFNQIIMFFYSDILSGAIAALSAAGALRLLSSRFSTP
jgi:hypothetical protein